MKYLYEIWCNWCLNEICIVIALKPVPDAYLSRYIGVQTSESVHVAKHHQFLLAHFLGSVVENATTQEGCNKLAEKSDVSDF